MYSVSSILRSAFRDSLEELRDQYTMLSGQSPEERERFVASINDHLGKVRLEIASERTDSAKRLMLKFLFITRVLCKSEGVDHRGLPSEMNYHNLVARAVRLSEDEKGEIESWRWWRPTETQFMDTLWAQLSKKEFDTQVRFLCDQVYGLRLPSGPETSINSWAKSVGLSEESWAWQYRTLLEKEHSRWFTSSTRIEEIQRLWESHRKDSLKCMESLSPLFPALGEARTRLERLRSEELSLSVRCNALNRAYEALKQGVQLKHLLLEEGHEMGNVFNRIL